jgi:GH15 family glucan-1,4-alpha-glucosidase
MFSNKSKAIADRLNDWDGDDFITPETVDAVLWALTMDFGLREEFDAAIVGIAQDIEKEREAMGS